MATVTITPDFLRGVGVNATVAESDAPWLSYAATIFGIDTPERVAHWFGQILHESGRGRHFAELRSRFASSGLRYKGRGWPQLTNDFNYRAYQTYLARTIRPDRERVPFADVMARPQLIEQLPHRTHCAGWYWMSERTNRFADLGVTREQVLNITARVWRPHRDAYHTATRWRDAQLAYTLIQDGLVMFDGAPVGVDMGNARDPVTETMRESLSLAKRGAFVKPSLAMGFAVEQEMPDGAVRPAPAGLAALGIIAVRALIG